MLEVGGNLVQLSLSFVGAAMGPLTGMFILGAAVPFANWQVHVFTLQYCLFAGQIIENKDSEWGILRGLREGLTWSQNIVDLCKKWNLSDDWVSIGQIPESKFMTHDS